MQWRVEDGSRGEERSREGSWGRCRPTSRGEAAPRAGARMSRAERERKQGVARAMGARLPRLPEERAGAVGHREVEERVEEEAPGESTTQRSLAGRCMEIRRKTSAGIRTTFSGVIFP